MFDFIVISGASRGFGKACALELSKEYPGAEFLLVASSQKGLEAVSGLFKERGTKCTTYGIDLADCRDSSTAGSLAAHLQQLPRDARVLFLHSAAILGPYKTLQQLDLQDISAVVQVNVAGTAALAHIITSSLPSTTALTCVNISTKCAVDPNMLAELDLYSMTKAASEMLFQRLATRGYRVLNYAPGPMKTDMVAPFADLKGMPWVSLEDSACGLLSLLKLGSFESGSHVDYLDDIMAGKSTAVAGVTANGHTEQQLAVAAGLANGTTTTSSSSSEAQHRCLISRIECFSASHTMSNCSWSTEQNKATFGKCSNLHGHNYKAEFSFWGDIDPDTGMVANISELKQVLQHVLGPLDHSHLNDHTQLFGKLVTTVENCARVLYEHVDAELKAAGSPATLHQVKLWETDKNIALYPFYQC